MAKEKIQPVRGMQDILPKEMRRHRKVTETAREVARLYGFEHMATPIMESIEVFKRTLGETSDVVNKEMYAFEDRKGREMVLRPENTASVVRAFISNGLQQSLPARFFYNGPMFRYERPQAGRQRQFHQIGIEALGTNNNYIADVDVIACGYQFLKELGLSDHVKLQINTLGSFDCREKYKDALVEYLTEYEEELSEDSQKRLKTNPLRILDSKDEHDKKIILEAPRLYDIVGDDYRFHRVLKALENLKIGYRLNPHLVRGLDYYCDTVFEFVTDDLGSQGTVLAGGRYNGLVKALGGNDIDGVGWAAGVERLALMLNEPEVNASQILLVFDDESLYDPVADLAYRLRNCGIRTDYLYDCNIKKQMQHADNIKSQFALRVEYSAWRLKNMKTGKEYDVSSLYKKIPKELQEINWISDLISILKDFH